MNRLALVVGIVLLLLSAGAFASGSGDSQKAATGPVTLRFSTYSDDTRIGAITTMVNNFMQKNPNVKVVVERTPSAGHYQKKLAETSSGTLPDVWELVPGVGAYWLERGLLLDIAPYVAKDTEINIPDFDETMLNYYKRGNKLLGLPYDFNGQGLYYNIGVFQKAGVAVPSSKWTFDDFYSTAKAVSTKLSTADTKVWGVATPPLTGWSGVGYFDPWGGPLVARDGTIGVSTTGTKQMLEYWLKMITEGIIPKPEPNNPQGVITAGLGLYLNGRAAMQMGSAGPLAVSEAAVKEGRLAYSVAPMPAGQGGLRGAKLGGGFVVTAATKYPLESYKLLEYLTSPEGQNIFLVAPKTGLPTRASQQKLLDPASMKFVEALQGGGYTWMNGVQGCLQLWTFKDKLLEQLWIGSLTSDQVVQQLVSEGTNILKSAAQQ